MRKKALFLSAIIFLCSFFTFSACKKQVLADTLYQIEVNLEQNVLSGKERVTYVNHTDTAIKELKFNLFGNAFRKDAKFSPVSAQHISQSYPNGLNYGNMEVKSVNGRDGELNFEVSGEDKNVLTVELGNEVFPEEKVWVDIEFTLNLANVVARTGINACAINLANFYPILCARDDNGFYECVYYSKGDPFYSDCADYVVKITADKKFTVASSGKLTDSKNSGDKTTNTYVIDDARSFAFVLSDKFEKITDNSTGVQIDYYYYDDKSPEVSMEYAVKSMKYFEKTFGEYPYPTYSVVQTQFVQGGMEFPALVMISDGLEQKAYGEVIVHETAHQWWQTVVGNNEIEYGFLDEGLAEYSVVLFYENHPEYNLSRKALINSAKDTYKVFCSVSDKLFGKVNTVMLRSLKDFNSEYEYVNMAYIKPCIMYDYLRQTIGDNKFFNGLKKYYSNYKFLNAVPDDLVGVYEKLGADTNGFFDSFFSGKVII
ncbi:MAG: M1 family metallopeptidase [Clostridiales bacterium]|nr:M1 family metallopeptidase [Clostridiales bacterium]